MNDLEKRSIIETLGNCENIKDPTKYFDEITQIKARFNQDPKLLRILNLFIAFGNPDRFLILDSIKQKDRCVCELEAIIDKSQPAVSHHLKLLEASHLIRGWKKGKFTHYSLVEKTYNEFESLWKEWCGETSNWFGK
jgi:ArsR family transcriptional regulator, arsenate/arsenite/antimonite-responsive transcriptional repressor